MNDKITRRQAIKQMGIAAVAGAAVENAHEFKFSSDEKHYDRMVTPETELTQWINLLNNN